MSDSARAVALVVSVLLWSPVAPSLLRGDISPERGIVMYAVAFALALAGCSVLLSIVNAYAPEPEPVPIAEPAADPDARTATADAQRRAEDAPA